MQIWLVFLSLLLSGCAGIAQPTIEEIGWKYQDLIAFDPIDQVDPAADMIALYQRSIPGVVEYRIDFLYLDGQPQYDIQFCFSFDRLESMDAIHTNDEKFHSDCTNNFRFHANTRTFTSTSNDSLDDHEIDYSYDQTSSFVVFRVDHDWFGEYSRINRLEVRLLSPNQDFIIDRFDPVTGEKSMPSHYRANLVLQFWNVLDGPTPAALLRAWNGAHAGPYGGRHGLFHLLEASSEYKVPIYLLDLKTPEAINSLIRLSALDMVEDLENSGQVLLPQASWGDPSLSAFSLEYGTRLTKASNLQVNQMIFSRSVTTTHPSAIHFAVLEDPTHLAREKGRKFIPFMGPYFVGENPEAKSFFANQVDLKGLTLDSRRRLFLSAINDDPYDLVVLGGSLPYSSWGDKAGASEAFKYLINQPWIAFPGYEDFITMPEKPGNKLSHACSDLLCIKSPKAQVQFFPYVNSNPIYIDIDAWQQDIHHRITSLSNQHYMQQVTLDFLRLIHNQTQIENPELAVSYYPLIERLLHAEHWITSPATHDKCTEYFWGADCVLASQTIYLSIDPTSGIMVFALVKSGDGYSYLIAPSGLFSVGISPPEQWNIQDGPFADPYGYPGIYTQSGEFAPHSYSLTNGVLTLTSPEGKQTHFTVDDHSVTMSNDIPGSRIIIPILGKPVASSSNERLSFEVSCHQDHCREKDLLIHLDFPGMSAGIKSTWDSLDYLSIPEDPNQNYPAGHFMPFPFTIVQLTGESNYVVTFSIE